MLSRRAVAFVVLVTLPAPARAARANRIAACAVRALSTAMAAPSKSKKTAVVWYKYSDLRVGDHEPLTAAHDAHDAVVHLFVWDPLWHGTTAQGGFPRCGHYRARFLLEAVADLRRALRAAGSELVVRCGDSADVVPAVAAAVGAAAVLTHAEVATEELALQARVAAGLRAAAPRAALTPLWGGQTLYHPDDLRAGGLDVARALPPVYSQFRRHAEGRCTVRPPLAPPRVWKVRTRGGASSRGRQAGGRYLILCSRRPALAPPPPNRSPPCPWQRRARTWRSRRGCRRLPPCRRGRPPTWARGSCPRWRRWACLTWHRTWRRWG
jgi:hypothetical protein